MVEQALPMYKARFQLSCRKANFNLHVLTLVTKFLGQMSFWELINGYIIDLRDLDMVKMSLHLCVTNI